MDFFNHLIKSLTTMHVGLHGYYYREKSTHFIHPKVSHRVMVAGAKISVLNRFVEVC